MMQPTTVQFGQWRPDDDANIAPGMPGIALNAQSVPLSDAMNMLYTASAWRLFNPLATSGTALAALPSDALAVDNAGTVNTFAGAAGHLYKINGAIVTDISKAGFYNAAATWQFVTFGDCFLATNGVDPVQDFGIATGTVSVDMAATAPKGYAIGVVRDFVVLGNTTDGTGSHTGRVQWSGLSNATSWPTPLTQDARAAQSGWQDLYSEYGAVQFIAQGEEFGIIFQQRALVRMRYIGGDVVFEFYTFDRKRGLLTPKAAAQMGNSVFFLSGDGFYATDGNTVKPIGYGSVNRWFFDKCYNTSKVRASVDTKTQCVYWSFPSTPGANDYVLIYNFVEDAWSYAVNTTYAMFQGLSAGAHIPQAFDVSNKLGSFTGIQAAGQITTKTFRLQASQRSLVTAARVLADDAATVAVAAIQSDDDAQVFGAQVARQARSRQSPLRSNGYGHALRVNFGSATTFAQAVEVDYTPRSFQ